jgi:hypothetical protein
MDDAVGGVYAYRPWTMLLGVFMLVWVASSSKIVYDSDLPQVVPPCCLFHALTISPFIPALAHLQS